MSTFSEKLNKFLDKRNYRVGLPHFFRSKAIWYCSLAIHPSTILNLGSGLSTKEAYLEALCNCNNPRLVSHSLQEDVRLRLLGHRPKVTTGVPTLKGK